jgi:hypothetical protein
VKERKARKKGKKKEKTKKNHSEIAKTLHRVYFCLILP